MPILKKTELDGYIGASLAKQITNAPSAFEQAEKASSAVVTQDTGLVVPALADDAPEWAKEAVAYMVLYRLIGTIPAATQTTMSWAGRMHELATDILGRHKESTPTGREGAEYKEIEGTLKW